MVPRNNAANFSNPLPNFNFIVEIGGIPEAGFSEIVMPEATIEVIEYREGADKVSSARKIAGRLSFTDIVLKRGITASKSLVDWWAASSQGTPQRQDMVIKLLDENHAPLRSWKLKNAWPAAIKFSSLNALGNEIAIEELRITYEGLNIE